MLALAQAASAVSATGGNTTNDIGGYRIHTFTNSGTFAVSAGGNVDVLVVAGGGGGGSGGPGKDTDSGGGGGGAGGLIQSNAVSVSAGGIAVTVGAGGIGGSAAGAAAGNGENSAFGPLSAVGGGRGACAQTAFAAGNGGSGGGASFTQITRGTGTAGQGNQGGSSFNAARYAGGSGGGAGAAGLDSTVQYGNGLNGGAGVSISISGAPEDYAGGGGSGAGGWWVTIGGTGGSGGGGNGGHGNNPAAIFPASAGTAATGGGGGGGGCTAINGTRPAGGAGGSGIVIVRYLWGAPAISNSSAVVTESHVTLNGCLISTGQDANVSAAVFWGTNDAGAGAAGWMYTNRFSGYAVEGLLSTNVTPGLIGTLYYFRFFATNAFGESWASPAGSFMTPGPPEVNNAGGAINLTMVSATLQGEVTGGSPTPSVRIFWGTANQGTNKLLWEHASPVAISSNGPFAAYVSIVPGSYYYRSHASNSFGEAWAPVTNFGIGVVHYVNRANTTPIAPYTSWAWAATNIQDALDWAVSNDVVIVTNGVYDFGGRAGYPAGCTLTNRVVLTNFAIVRAASTNPADTLIVGAPDTGTGSNGPAAVRCAFLNTNCTLAGFTLTNGYTSDTSLGVVNGNGGGAYCQAASSLLTNCVVTMCQAALYGGGVYQGLLRNCEITGNSASSGGGVYGGTLTSCTISYNYAFGSGGGVASCTIYDSLIFTNIATNAGGGALNGTMIGCRLQNNVAGGGGGSYNANASNCVISGNISVGGGGYGGYGGGMSGGYAYNCLFVSNFTVAYGGGYGSGGYNGPLEYCEFRGNRAGTANAIQGAIVRNCLIVNNGVGGVTLRDTRLYNCTVVSNNGVGAWMSCHGTNNIIWGNLPWDVNSYPQTFYWSYCCFGKTGSVGTVVGEGNTTGNPVFVDETNGNYRLASARSSCFNAGYYLAGMSNSVDLDGNPRIRNTQVDIGAYEIWIKSGTIFRGK